MDTRIIYFFIVLIIISQKSTAQINDTFSDGNLTNNPVWQGDTNKFQVINEVLQSNGTENQSPIYLSIPNTALDDIVWKFRVKLNFNPSNNNFARVYLVSDKPNLTSTTLSGYFIRIGERLNEDGIDLFKQTADGLAEKIIDGVAGQVAAKPDVGIKVTRSSVGQWEISADLNGGDSFTELVGTVTDNGISSTAFFGVVCNYTNSNTQNFYFDDFVIEPTLDFKSPEVISVVAVTEKLVEVTFSEPLEITSAQNVNHYSVSQSVGKPTNATLIASNKVQLVFTKAFEEGTSHTLSISNISDLSSNILVVATLDFTWQPSVSTTFRDLVINEIFADPSPSIGLPGSEFIEIYNTSSKTVHVKNWTLSDPTKIAMFPSFTLAPSEYLILCPQEEIDRFAGFGNILGLSPWPTLNNNGDNILLKDETGKIIDSVSYNTSWYRDAQKAKGGWSLEQINPTTICNFAQNWRASIDVIGGTPGNKNAVFDPSSDLIPPTLLTAIATGNNQVQLVFNETINRVSAENAQYLISPEIQIAHIQVIEGELNIVSLTLEDGLLPKTIYEINVKNIADCEGNIIGTTNNTAKFSLPEIADSLDIIINEVLFNPLSGGVDFVEIFNRSDKYINLHNWKITNERDASYEDSKIISNSHLIIAPSRFLVFTVNAQVLKGDYPSGQEMFFIETNLPSFPDEKGSVMLLNSERSMIDFFEYDESYHFSLIKDPNGVSLERISANAPTNDINNWHSAASTVGYATPGYVNSQSIIDNTLADKVRISPKVFLPDNLGIDDFTTIHYNFESNGFVANIFVFDVAGRIVKTIAKNDLLPRSGFYTWDGLNDNRTKVNMGYYIVVFEIFNPQGQVLKFKKTVAVAGRF